MTRLYGQGKMPSPQNLSDVIASTASSFYPEVFMLVGHPPHKDPRVDWVADSVADLAKVQIFGVSAQEETSVYYNFKNNYKKISVPQVKYKDIDHKRRFLHMIWKALDLIKNGRLSGLLSFGLFLISALFLELYIRLIIKVGIRKTFSRIWSHLKRLLKGGENPQKRPVFCGHNTRLPSYEKYLRFKWLLSHFTTVTLSLWQHLDSSMSSPHLIHCHDLDTLLVGVLCKKRYGCKLVYDAHEFWAYAYEQPAWYQTRFFLWLEGSLIRYADYAVTVSPPLAEVMANTHQIPRVDSLPNCEPWQERNNLPQKTDLDKLAGGRIKFLFQGGFATTRGIEDLIQAWQEIDSNRAALFLRGPNNRFKEFCKELAAYYGVLDKSVYFLEPVSEEYLISAATEADVGLIPYLPVTLNNQYACPNKLSQYMQAGLMVVSTDLVYVKEIIERSACGMTYQAGNLESLKSVILKAIESKEFRNLCRDNALSYSKAIYNWQNQSAVLKTMYTTLLSLPQVKTASLD